MSICLPPKPTDQEPGTLSLQSYTPYGFGTKMHRELLKLPGTFHKKGVKTMKERDFLRISSYPKPVDKEWQNKIDAHIKKHGVKQLGHADNQNPSFDFNGGVFNFGKGGK